MSVTASISASNSTVYVALELMSSQYTIGYNNSTNNSHSSVIILSETTYYFIGSLMALVFLLGVTENSMILIIYAMNRKIRTVNNVFVFGLAISDLGQAVLNIPLFMVSSFSKTWIFGDGGCVYYAFVTTTFGIAQIALLTVIALERYFIIVHHNRRLSASMSKAVCTITSCFIFAIVWSTGPLVGWSNYEMEKAGIACCVSWDVRKPINLSFTMSLFTFGWFIPLVLISYGYTSIAFEIYKERSKKHTLGKSSLLRKKTCRERKVAITVLLMIGAFVFSWMPYSIVSLCSAIMDMDEYSHLIILAPAIFAKSSIIWNPIIYVARHNDFLRAGRHTFKNCSISCFTNHSKTHFARESINRPGSYCGNTAKPSVSFGSKPQYFVYKSSYASTDTSAEIAYHAERLPQVENSKPTNMFCKAGGKRYRLITSTDIEDSLIEITDHESSDAFERASDSNNCDMSGNSKQLQPNAPLFENISKETQIDLYDKYLRRKRYDFTKSRSERAKSLGSYKLKSQVSTDKEKCLATLKRQREDIKKMLNDVLFTNKIDCNSAKTAEISNVGSEINHLHFDRSMYPASDNTENIVDIYSQSRLRIYGHTYGASTSFPFPEPSTSSSERRALSDSACRPKNKICYKGAVRPRLKRQESHISQRGSMRRKQARTAMSKREHFHHGIPVEMTSLSSPRASNEPSQIHDYDHRIVLRQSTV